MVELVHFLCAIYSRPKDTTACTRPHIQNQTICTEDMLLNHCYHLHVKLQCIMTPNPNRMKSNRFFLPVSKQLYLTERYLNMVTQGSPNQLFVAVRKQLIFPSHLVRTVTIEPLEALQCVFPVLPAGQMLFVRRPYIAPRMRITDPAGQLTVLDDPSQMFTDWI